MRDTICNLIGGNRNNKTQRISIAVTEHFSKPKETLNEKPVFDPSTGITHKSGTILVPTD